MALYIKLLFLKEKLEKLLHCNTNRAGGWLLWGGGSCMLVCFIRVKADSFLLSLVMTLKFSILCEELN